MEDSVTSGIDRAIFKDPLVFISHDSRDREIAEAFSELLGSVSMGLLRSFRSSDKKGDDGIQFGDNWYARLMERLDSASDVVCLLTAQSINRPWILYEAGVATGKLDTPVHGLALGVDLNELSDGPFFQFQNCDDSEESLTKLVRQLCKRIRGSKPDADVISQKVRKFKEAVAKATSSQAPDGTGETSSPEDKDAAARVLEQMKQMVRDLPERVDRIASRGSTRYGSRLPLSIHPIKIPEIADMFADRLNNPAGGLLVIASMFKDDFPWLYELALDAYRAGKSNNRREANQAIRAFRTAADLTLRGPFRHEMTSQSQNTATLLDELIKFHIGALDALSAKDMEDESSSTD